MTWSYSGNPDDSPKDAVRFYCGDTDRRDQLVQNEEILFLLSKQPNVVIAAADACDVIATGFARFVDSRVGDIQESASKRMDQYKKRADDLRKGKYGGAGSVEWFVGGLSKSGKESLRSDSDAVQPTFAEGQDDHPDVGEVDDWRNRC
jgi:hypothetical protein